MPALLPLLSLGRILGTANRCHHVVLGHTDIAADAFPDILEATLVNLARQKGIGNRRARRTDQVEHTALYLRNHRVCGSKPPYPDDRFSGQRFDKRGIGLLESLVGLEPRSG